MDGTRGWVVASALPNFQGLETPPKDVSVGEPKVVAGQAYPMGQADVIRILDREEVGLQIGEDVIEGHELAEIPAVAIGPHSRMGRPETQQFIGAAGCGVIDQMHESLRSFLFEHARERLRDEFEVAVERQYHIALDRPLRKSPRVGGPANPHDPHIAAAALARRGREGRGS